MMEKTGKLIGVGVGPGDPELITVKALKAMEKADVIAVPTKDPAKSTAYRIAEKAWPRLAEKETLGLEFPMTKVPETLEKARRENEEKLCRCLDAGKTVAFLTLGDPTLYSTFFKVAPEIQTRGYTVDIVSGIPAFCAVAASAGVAVSDRDEPVLICPGVPEKAELLPAGTTVFMKPGRKLGVLKRQLLEAEHQGGCIVCGMERCGMGDEQAFFGAENIPEDAGYFTTVIAKNIR